MWTRFLEHPRLYWRTLTKLAQSVHIDTYLLGAHATYCMCTHSLSGHSGIGTAGQSPASQDPGFSSA